MEEPASPPSSSSAGGELSGETQESVFAQLRPYCLDLLALTRSPRREAPFLSDMADFLRRAPASLLQPCLDYTLLPLLLLLGAAVESRSQQTLKSGMVVGSGSRLKGHIFSDNVAEGALRCLVELLSKCHLTSVDQMAMVLKKLALGASLSPSEAAEEFREGIIRCVRAVLQLVEPCSSESCTCKEVAMLPACMSTSILQSHVTSPSKYHSESEECLLAFLQSPNASAAVGHWLSLLFQAAETEAERGLRGSAKLRKEAFLTLRVLIVKIGSADALAFFLPGVVSRFTKALHATKSILSGAAGSAGSIDHAVRGLTEFLVIVLRDESNVYALDMSINNAIGLYLDKKKSSESVLEALRHLPVHGPGQDESSAESSIEPSVGLFSFQHDESTHYDRSKSLYVQRTKAWIEETSLRVDQLLSAIFPHLCVHPAEKVRQGIVHGIRGILFNCCTTLKRSKLMLLECLCVLVCDDSDIVSTDAQVAFESLFMFKEKYFRETELAEMFNRLVEMLPRVVLGSEESVAVSHAQKLLALMYYVGPDVVVDHLLHPPIKAAQFLEVLGSSLSQSSLYYGSVDKLILSKPLSIGYLQSVAELKASSPFELRDHGITSGTSLASKISFVQDTNVKGSQGAAYNNYELPHMPPWFVNVGSEKLYTALAGILRLLGLAIIAEHRSDVSLSLVIDTPLESFRKLISEIRKKGYSKENWQSWYSRSGFGQLVRQASTAACVLNEIIYGTSDRSADLYAQLFGRNKAKIRESQENQVMCVNNKLVYDVQQGKSVWKSSQDAKEQVIYSVGSILHEYLSPEVWDLPVDEKSLKLLQGIEAENLSLHFLRDDIMLHQVLVEGIGIFNLSLGKHFVQSGFMHSCLYLLLQNLICSSNQIRNASDAVLHVVSIASGYPTVGHLVVSNADYIIDSLCRQLRHLDLNPHVPDVLAAMLSYIGAAHEILPLLEEPMRSVSMELEVLSRSQHPSLTVPFLKAIGEIIRASRREASAVTNEAESFYMLVKPKVTGAEKAGKENFSVSCTVSHVGIFESEKIGNSSELRLEHWEELLLKLSEMKRHRRIIGSIAESCLKSATPLLVSVKESACLAALDIVEEGIVALAKVEDAYKHEKETKEAIEREIQLCSSQDLEDFADTSDEGVDENRLLPAMNKIWPYLVLCIKNRTSAAVIRRCMCVLSSAVQVCGGDFFIRRFRTDGFFIWKLLTTSPFRKNPLPSKGEKPILLPYRSTSVSLEDSMAEVSSLKIQEAVLNMIAEISTNKRSASAVEAVLKKVSSLVVGIACSSVTNLREASVKALSGLACIDPDLVWLLLADVSYSLKPKDATLPPTSDFTEISLLLPPPSSSKDYLYIQYGGEGSGFNVDPSAVEIVYRRMFEMDL
uniref:TELO2-interacting protein 1 n=1 Tax=Anthurium amnicola TaxID=1678845 RepID=A0A1D1ZHU6_9ARAE